jgi:phosphotriesterase-related protein
MSGRPRQAQTVLGPVDAGALGLTMMHEHLLIHATHIAKAPPAEPERGLFEEPVTIGLLGRLRYGRLVNRDNCRLADEETAIAETALFKQAGGGTIVDATSLGIGRDPGGLRRIAEATGLNIVMGSSYYVEETHPAAHRVAQRSEGDLAEAIARDVMEGAEGTGIRAGLIGEVGCSWPLTTTEAKVLRASARAQRLTGAPLMIHPGRDQRAPGEILGILDRAGADLSRTVLCHIDRTVDRPELLSELAATGCILEYDLFGFEHSYYAWSLPVDMPNDAGRLRWLRWLIERGHLAQLVVSHDICFKDKLARYGGHGYAHILANVVPLMRERGFTEAEIAAILVDNPRRLLAFA